MPAESVHVPVMPREVLQYLSLSPGLTVMDGTVGAAGHSSQILQQIGPAGRLLGFDRDPMMLSYARQKLNAENVSLHHASYAEAADVLKSDDPDGVDRVLIDLGLSSDQLADRDRGFGFDAGGVLDMRFDTSSGRPAADLVNEAAADELEQILQQYGEERHAGQIARIICDRRRRQPLRTTADLEDCVQAAIPSNQRGRSGRNPATQVFQALRIAVNEELKHVQEMMSSTLPQILRQGGIAVVITFHSLEDRIVKSAFKGKNEWQALTKTPVEPTPAEVRLNPRSRSAKLRAAARM